MIHHDENEQMAEMFSHVLSSKQSHKKRVSYAGLTLLLLSGMLVLVGVILGALFFLKQNTNRTVNQSQDSLEIVQNLKRTLSFSPYYPLHLPDGFTVDHTTVQAQAQTLSFTIRTDSNESIVVTQQSRPTLMEEVNKTAEFRTPIGTAYTADIEGNAAGFIVTDSTLLIISNVSESIASKLKDILLSFDRI